MEKKKRFATLRAALVCLVIFTVLCGVIYPISVTLIAQAAFPYEANGSLIIVTMPDGTKKNFGSELIGQSYEDAKYMFGRVNTLAPSNLAPESSEYKELLQKRLKERKEKLQAIGYNETADVPHELLSAGGSGVDPHISVATAHFQVPVIVKARNLKIENEEDKITEQMVLDIIKKYTEGKFLFIFGEERVNVLLCNLALDGVI